MVNEIKLSDTSKKLLNNSMKKAYLWFNFFLAPITYFAENKKSSSSSHHSLNLNIISGVIQTSDYKKKENAAIVKSLPNFRHGNFYASQTNANKFSSFFTTQELSIVL